MPRDQAPQGMDGRNATKGFHAMTLRPGISVVVPTIPPRWQLLSRALESFNASVDELRRRKFTVPVHLATVTDGAKLGAAATRDRGLRSVETEWVAFLDDDDEFLPGHLSALYGTA